MTALLDTSETIEDHLGRNRVFRSKQAEIDWLRGSVTQLQAERDELYGIGGSEYERGKKDGRADREGELLAALDGYVAMEARATDRLQAQVGAWTDDTYRRLGADWPDIAETAKALMGRVVELAPALGALDSMIRSLNTVAYPGRAERLARVYEVFDRLVPMLHAGLGRLFLDVLLLAHRYRFDAHAVAVALHAEDQAEHWAIGANATLARVGDKEGEVPARPGLKRVPGRPVCYFCGGEAPYRDGVGRDFCGQHAPRCSACQGLEGVQRYYALLPGEGIPSGTDLCPAHAPQDGEYSYSGESLSHVAMPEHRQGEETDDAAQVGA